MMHRKMGINTAGHVFIYLVRPGQGFLATIFIYDRWRQSLLLQEFAFGFIILALQVYLALFNFNFTFRLWHNLFRTTESIIVSTYLLSQLMSCGQIPIYSFRLQLVSCSRAVLIDSPDFPIVLFFCGFCTFLPFFCVFL